MILSLHRFILYPELFKNLFTYSYNNLRYAKWAMYIYITWSLEFNGRGSRRRNAIIIQVLSKEVNFLCFESAAHT